MQMGRSTFVLGLAGIVVVLSSLQRFGDRDFDGRERVRLQSHFDSVLGELRSRDVSKLGGAQRERRAKLVRTLQAYRDAGAFPHNYDVPGRMIPSFVDTKTGARCAVGHLLETTGRADIVSRVAQTNLHVYAMDLGGDREFTAWLDDQGLTLAEAARIQPSYPWREDAPRTRWNVAAGLAAAGSASLAVVNLTSNSRGSNKALSAVGLGIGLGTAAFSRELLSAGAAEDGLAKTAIGAGFVSAAASLMTLWGGPDESASARRLSVRPLVAPISKAAPQLGLTGRFRF